MPSSADCAADSATPAAATSAASSNRSERDEGPAAEVAREPSADVLGGADPSGVIEAFDRDLEVAELVVESGPGQIECETAGHCRSWPDGGFHPVGDLQRGRGSSCDNEVVQHQALEPSP